MTREEHADMMKRLRQKTMREVAKENPDLTWTDIEEVFARYDAGRRYISDIEH